MQLIYRGRKGGAQWKKRVAFRRENEVLLSITRRVGRTAKTRFIPGSSRRIDVTSSPPSRSDYEANGVPSRNHPRQRVLDSTASSLSYRQLERMLDERVQWKSSRAYWRKSEMPFVICLLFRESFNYPQYSRRKICWMEFSSKKAIIRYYICSAISFIQKVLSN